MKTLLSLLFLMFLHCGNSAYGQAFCALRDPAGMIQKMAPNASGHRSITELVGGAARGQVGEKLPFTLHFNELGKHTLYVIMKDGKPDSLMHARSEKGKWGLVEIVWLLDLDLRVRDFSFQRCRDRNSKELEGEAFVSQLRGKSFDSLRSLFDASGSLINPGQFNVSPSALTLAETCVRSALKTIAVTDIVWQQHLPKLRAAASVVEAIDVEGLAIVSGDCTLEAIEEVYNPKVMKVLAAIHQEDEWIIDRDTVTGNRVLTKAGDLLGLFIETNCTADQKIVQVSWVVSAKSKIVAVKLLSDKPGLDVIEAFAGLEGISLELISNCATPGQLAAGEVLAISAGNLNS